MRCGADGLIVSHARTSVCFWYRGAARADKDRIPLSARRKCDEDRGVAKLGVTDGPSTIGAKAKEMTRHLTCSFLDSMFLGLWAIPNLYVGKFVESHPFTGIDQIVLRCLQVLFGISTLAPVCIWTYKDTRIMFIRANQEIGASIIPQAIAPSPNIPQIPGDAQRSNDAD
jgi:hypothetical protein